MKVANASSAASLLFALSCCTSATAYHVPIGHAAVRRLADAPHRPRVLHAVRCTEEAEKKDSQIIGQVIGYSAIGGQLLFPFLVGLQRLGLIELPPLNAFTAIANNASDEAIAIGTINPYTATVYGQGIWKDLITEYYSSGKTTEFLTKAGGICAEHAAWCDGVSIPLTGGMVQ